MLLAPVTVWPSLTSATGVALCLILIGYMPVPVPGKLLVSPQVHGRVMDRTTRQPVAGATVMLQEETGGKVNNRSKSATDPDGLFTVGPEQHSYYVAVVTPCPVYHIPEEPPYAWLLEITSPGYQAQQIDMRERYSQLNNNVLQLGDIELEPITTVSPASEAAP